MSNVTITKKNIKKMNEGEIIQLRFNGTSVKMQIGRHYNSDKYIVRAYIVPEWLMYEGVYEKALTLKEVYTKLDLQINLLKKLGYNN